MVKTEMLVTFFRLTKWWSLEMSGNGGNLKGINRNSLFPPRPTSCVVTKAENIIAQKIDPRTRALYTAKKQAQVLSEAKRFSRHLYIWEHEMYI